MFKESDYQWLKVIECMKNAGMPIKDIRKYIQLTIQGDSTIHERLGTFQPQRKILQAQMASLQRTLDVLDYKCWYYEQLKKLVPSKPHRICLWKRSLKYQKIRLNLTNVPDIPK